MIVRRTGVAVGSRDRLGRARHLAGTAPPFRLIEFFLMAERTAMPVADDTEGPAGRARVPPDLRHSCCWSGSVVRGSPHACGSREHQGVRRGVRLRREAAVADPGGT